MIEKRGNKWAVVHGHPQKSGSKTDKPKGSVIAYHDTYAKALAQHRAIEASKQRKKQGVNLHGEALKNLTKGR